MDGLTRAETRSCSKVFNKDMLCLKGIYWYSWTDLQSNRIMDARHVHYIALNGRCSNVSPASALTSKRNRLIQSWRPTVVRKNRHTCYVFKRRVFSHFDQTLNLLTRFSKDPKHEISRKSVDHICCDPFRRTEGERDRSVPIDLWKCQEQRPLSYWH